MVVTIHAAEIGPVTIRILGDLVAPDGESLRTCYGFRPSVNEVPSGEVVIQCV
jgi:hypothetical protein